MQRLSAINFDQAASSVVDPRVADKVMQCFRMELANNSSIHQAGVRAAAHLENAREVIAESLGLRSSFELIFCSGGTEANNWVLHAFLNIMSSEKSAPRPHFIVSSIEHSSIRQPAIWMARQGWIDLDEAPVDDEGFIRLKELESLVRPETRLISIMHANNEIGVIQDLKSIGEIAQRNKVVFHTDACQSFLKTPINVQEIKVDLLSINAHKCHGPRGIGGLYVRRGLELEPWFRGGGQERGLRSGTPAVELAAGFAEAVKCWTTWPDSPNNSSSHAESVTQHLAGLRQRLIDRVLQELPLARLNGPRSGQVLPNIVNFSFIGLEAKPLMRQLDQLGFATATGSACSSGKLTTSYVLRALGRRPDAQEGLRVSFSKWHSQDDVDRLAEALCRVVERLHSEQARSNSQ